MKCSFRRNCNAGSGIPSDEPPSLNEVQFPKELQRAVTPEIESGNVPQ